MADPKPRHIPNQAAVSGPSRGRVTPRGPAVVALGGGHGLSASLKALRHLTDDVTAIVGVADDGGSSGRIRGELGLPPPGDLRMALAALCGDDVWGRTWSQVMQHRFGGNGEMAGHATGNLLIAALWEESGSIVAGLDWVAALLGAHGRVLPVSTIPLDIVAQVQGVNPAEPAAISTIVGQVELEHSRGTVVDLSVRPADPPACPESVAAIELADAIVLGPGSWYTSVLPHLLVPGVRAALATASARRILVLNLDGKRESDPEAVGSTQDFTSAKYLKVWRQLCSDVDLDYVLADPRYVDDEVALAQACAEVNAELVLERIAVKNQGGQVSSPRHDSHLLAAALGNLLPRGNI